MPLAQRRPRTGWLAGRLRVARAELTPRARKSVPRQAPRMRSASSGSSGCVRAAAPSARYDYTPPPRRSTPKRTPRRASSCKTLFPRRSIVLRARRGPPKKTHGTHGVRDADSCTEARCGHRSRVVGLRVRDTHAPRVAITFSAEIRLSARVLRSVRSLPSFRTVRPDRGAACLRPALDRSCRR